MSEFFVFHTLVFFSKVPSLKTIFKVKITNTRKKLLIPKIIFTFD